MAICASSFLHDLLSEKASRLAPGERGLLAYAEFHRLVDYVARGVNLVMETFHKTKRDSDNSGSSAV
jgi:hypothetical protein